MTTYNLYQCLTCNGSGRVRGWQSGQYTPSGWSTCYRCDGQGRVIVTTDGERPAPEGTPWNQATVDVEDAA